MIRAYQAIPSFSSRFCAASGKIGATFDDADTMVSMSIRIRAAWQNVKRGHGVSASLAASE
jgi:hypothetical protein